MPENVIECDYLVVGAGAASLAFVDELVARSDVDVVMLDRRDRPGGHWTQAYSFVRLHQPSATYGVNSLPLGSDAIDVDGPNVGFYECATGTEICDHFDRAVSDVLVPTGRVRFLPMTDYVGDFGDRHAFVSLLTGARTEVRVRRRVVDGTHLECSIPATHQPGFEVDADARLVPVGQLPLVTAPPDGFTVLGSGKTAMDACTWLLGNGVDPDRIRWIRPRDAWLTDRAAVQPLDLIGLTIEAFGSCVSTLAGAPSEAALFEELEASGQIHRLDPAVTPTMYRGAILPVAERDALRQIERVVRMGRVKRITGDRIILDGGEVPTSTGELHVDCTARGLGSAPPRPIFEDRRITIQSLTGGFTTYNAALVAVVEASDRDDAERNRLCPPVAPPTRARDWIAFYRATIQTAGLHGGEEDLAAFQDTARLSLTRGLSASFGDPRVVAGVNRWLSSADDALAAADRLLATPVGS